MTVDEIDVLEGRALDSAVARAKCWAGDEMFPRYSSDSRLSVELLLGCDQWFDVCNRPNEKPPVCYINLGDTVEADGETFPVAACRAFLKLKRLESGMDKKPTKQAVECMIREFAASHLAAEKNAGVMVGNPSAKAVDECAVRMERVDAAESAIFGIQDSGELPPVLSEFLGAEADKGCFDCWVTSRVEQRHTACSAKIAHWFDSRDALIKYGQHLLNSDRNVARNCLGSTDRGENGLYGPVGV